MFTTKYEVIVVSGTNKSVLHFKANSSIGLRMLDTVVNSAVNGEITFRDPETNKPIRKPVSFVTDCDSLVFNRLPDDYQDRVIKVTVERKEYYIVGDLPLFKIHERLYKEFERFGKLRMRSARSNKFRDVTSLAGGIMLEEVVNSEEISSRVFHDRTENYGTRLKGGKIYL